MRILFILLSFQIILPLSLSAQSTAKIDTTLIEAELLNRIKKLKYNVEYKGKRMKKTLKKDGDKRAERLIATYDSIAVGHNRILLDIKAQLQQGDAEDSLAISTATYDKEIDFLEGETRKFYAMSSAYLERQMRLKQRKVSRASGTKKSNRTKTSGKWQDSGRGNGSGKRDLLEPQIPAGEFRSTNTLRNDAALRGPTQKEKTSRFSTGYLDKYLVEPLQIRLWEDL